MSYFQAQDNADYVKPPVVQPAGTGNQPNQGNYAYQQPPPNYQQPPPNYQQPPPNYQQPMYPPQGQPQGYPPQGQPQQYPPQGQPYGAQYQQPQYQQGQPVMYAQPQQSVMITGQVNVRPQTVVMGSSMIVPMNTGNICRFCGKDHVIITSRKIGFGTILISILLILIFWPLFWLPCVIDDCKDKVYVCNQCGKVLSEKSMC